VVHDADVEILEDTGALSLLPQPADAVLELEIDPGPPLEILIPGNQGPPGPASTVPGPTGPAGTAGVAGAAGAQGPQGIQGPQGPTGPTGAAGAAGAAGATGATGPTGPPGMVGAAFKVGGTLSVAAGATRLYNDTLATWTIGSVRATVETAPSGGSVVVDVNKNGTTIFTTQANRPTIATATLTSGKVTTMNITSVAPGDYLTVDVDTTTAPAAELTVLVVIG
jgi:hypothetical protein